MCARARVCVCVCVCVCLLIYQHMNSLLSQFLVVEIIFERFFNFYFSNNATGSAKIQSQLHNLFPSLLHLDSI